MYGHITTINETEYIKDFWSLIWVSELDQIERKKQQQQKPS